ncbi:hypothetical protein A2W24_05910 [Microgenomates group bacterium RBG_16_45_19]|nr:MAG: hypothetical protein A2W24_05910 [Microgenomates group bacterium RBG_16_45_19]
MTETFKLSCFERSLWLSFSGFIAIAVLAEGHPEGLIITIPFLLIALSDLYPANSEKQPPQN